MRHHSRRNAEAALLLGHAYFRKGWRSDGLREYDSAIKLAPGLRRNGALVHNTVSALRGRRPIATPAPSSACASCCGAARGPPPRRAHQPQLAAARAAGAAGAGIGRGRRRRGRASRDVAVAVGGASGPTLGTCGVARRDTRRAATRLTIAPPLGNQRRCALLAGDRLVDPALLELQHRQRVEALVAARIDRDRAQRERQADIGLVDVGIEPGNLVELPRRRGDARRPRTSSCVRSMAGPRASGASREICRMPALPTSALR